MNGAHRTSAVITAAAALCGATVAGTTSPAPAVAASSTAGRVPRLDWRPCGPGLQRFQCTSVAVPLDHDRPSGPRVTLALTRLPASGPPGRRLGTLFTNPGGPGGSGVQFVQQAVEVAFSPQVRARYDVVGFDPRGVASSTPATCYRTEAQEQSAPAATAQYPRDVTDAPRYTAVMLALAVRCQAQSPIRLSTASTANVARDLDLLRQAVGDQRLHYVGYSYGTFLGATYARLFPDRVGRWVLDGTVDPVAWTGTGTGDAAPSTPLGVRVRQGEGAADTFAEFTRLCRRAGPARCPLAGLGEPGAVTEALLQRLARHPVRVPLPDGSSVLVTQQYLVQSLFFTLYSPAYWGDMAQVLAELAAPVPNGRRVAAAAAGTPTPLGARVRGADYPSVGGALASLCVDTAHSGRWWEYPRRADAAARRFGHFGRFRAWVGLPCEAWQLRDPDAYTGPWRQRTSSPVLVIGTRHDPATPYRQTAPFTRLFPQGRMLTLDGWGHTSIGQSRCVDDDVTGYLVGGVLPAAGASCRPDAVPFSGIPANRRVPGAARRPLLPLGPPVTPWW